MSLSVESFRLWAPWFVGHVLWPVLWQSSILIGLVFVLDLVLLRRVRPAVRYGLWLVVLLKLVLPPSLSFPTGLAWWLRPAARVSQTAPGTIYTISYESSVESTSPPSVASTQAAAMSPLPLSAWALLASAGVTFLLLGFLSLGWARVARIARLAAPAPQWMQELQEETLRIAGPNAASPFRIQVRLTRLAMSPAVCGFFRPVLLVPEHLISELPRHRLRAILLHEVIHLRRGDVWVNCAQTLLQVVYWWHPLLWLANARIRLLREQAVDDAVMLALREEAPEYAPTLLAVARLALARPLASLGLVGIVEPRTTLRRRIERLADFHPPRRAGLTLASVLGLGLFTALAVPMGQAPGMLQSHMGSAASDSNPWPDPRFQGYGEVRLEADFVLVNNSSSLAARFPTLLQSTTPLVLGQNEAAELDQTLRLANALRPAPAISFAKFSGGTFRWHVGGPTNNLVNYHTRDAAGRSIVLGADADVLVNRADWVPLVLTVVPWTEGDNLRCDLDLALKDRPESLLQAQALLPARGTLVWAKQLGDFSGRLELVILRVQPVKLAIKPASNNEPPPAPPTQAEPAPLYVRIFQVAPAAFVQALQAVPDVDGGMALWPPDAVSGSNTLTRVRALCENLGVKLTPPKTVFYNDEGRLFIRATRQEIDTLDEALRTLGLLTNNTQSFAVRQLRSGTNIDATSSRVPIFGGDIPILGRLFQTNAASTANTNGPQIHIKSSFISLPGSSMTDLQRLLGSTYAGRTNALLSPPQTAMLLKALQANGEVELLGQASLTTLSGRQAQISIEPAASEAGKTTSEKVPPAVLYLDVIPTAQLAPGLLVQLTGTASTGPSSVTPSQIHFDIAIPNGHTLVLRDPSPGSGSDAPTSTKYLLVLITPTLIDAVGNPIHN